MHPILTKKRYKILFLVAPITTSTVASVIANTTEKEEERMHNEEKVILYVLDSLL